MPNVISQGAGSAQGFGFAARQTAANYIEDVFSTYLYTGNGSTQTITNGIDLSTKGGLVWIKDRQNVSYHCLTDTARGVNKLLFSNLTSASTTAANTVTAFNADGFSLGADGSGYGTNDSGAATVSWTFRKQAKFFDIVTYTGNGVAGRTVAHNLGSVPGCIIVKRTDVSGQWATYHRSLNGGTGNGFLSLNTTNAASNLGYVYWGSGSTYTAPTSTVFTVSDDGSVNDNGGTYVAYLFAHDAGGFGLSGTDNVISCGSYSGTGAAGNSISLGYEPQFVLIKRTDAAGYDWNMWDIMRGMSQTQSARLSANLSSAEVVGSTAIVIPQSTGFSLNATTAAFNASGGTYIYIAIRRGPMKTPTSGTSVYEPVSFTGNNTANTTRGTTITTDLAIISATNAGSPQATYNQAFYDRLRGENVSLTSSNTNAEVTGWGNTYFNLDQQIGWSNGSNTAYLNNSSITYVTYNLRRAPGFFDEVCYTGTGSATTQSHNLGVVPELMIFKRRDAAAQWQFYFSALGNTKTVQCPDLDISTSSGYFNNTSPTSSVFTVNTVSSVNASGGTYVAYLAASCAGVSKVGSYTGTGSTQTIDCGFSGGARFVLIKNVGSNAYAYPFYVWDTARGMISGTDPSLQLNSTAAEVNANSVYTTSSGFQIVSTATGINGNGKSFVYWAIA